MQPIMEESKITAPSIKRHGAAASVAFFFAHLKSFPGAFAQKGFPGN